PEHAAARGGLPEPGRRRCHSACLAWRACGDGGTCPERALALVFRATCWLSARGGNPNRRKGARLMSLTVSPELLSRAQRGPVSDAEFIECIRASLPYAWSVVSELAEELSTGGTQFADNQAPPPDENAQGELLRMMASDAMRSAVERHFGVRVAFQNCCR